MHRYFFSLRIAVIVVLAAIAVASIDLYTRGFAVVHDPDGVVARAVVAYGRNEVSMREFADGYHAARPRGDGAIRIECRSGVTVNGGYVTGGMQTAYTVTRADCDPVAGRRSRA